MRHFIFLVVLFGGMSPVFATTSYKLQFHAAPELHLSFSFFELPPIFADKVGTESNIVDTKQLTPMRKLKRGEFELLPGQSILLAVVVKSGAGKALDFFVSPHHTHPADRALDFNFSCLCYHHVYHLEAGKLWYRVLRLTDVSTTDKKEKVLLSHEVLRWTGEEH